MPRRLLDRMLRRPLAERLLASLRWRSGLDADLDELRRHAADQARRVAASHAQAAAAAAHLADELRETEVALKRLEQALGTLGRRTADLEARAPAIDDRLANLERAQDATAAGVRLATERLDQLAARDGVTRADERLATLEATAQLARTWADITLRSTWCALSPLAGDPRVSIVLPTRNRSALLRRAIASVLAQPYPHWELLVIDDASTDDTRAVIAAFDDSRIRLLAGDGSGAGRARNLGLREASGAFVTFLDDDNLMAPGWLRAAVVTFQERPELSAVYGAQLRAREPDRSGEPTLLFVCPFDWSRLVQHNFIDLGVVVHRAGLPGLSFDEGLPRLIDWDYIVNLAGRFGIEALPVVASVYNTDAPMRISHRACLEREADRLRRRFQDRFGPAVPSAPTPSEGGAPRLATRGSGKAWMTAADADLVEHVLRKLGERFGGELRVLEWGSGLSTLHYPTFLAAHAVRASWLSIEHDRARFEAAIASPLRERGGTIVWPEELPRAAAAATPPGEGVTAVVFDKGPINPFDPNPNRYADRGKDLDDYVGLPAALGLRFHVVLVDGRKRRRCLLAAASLLEPGGVVLLHDAQRPYYHPAFAAYRSGRRIGDELWIGALEATDFADLVPEAARSATGFTYVPGT